MNISLSDVSIIMLYLVGLSSAFVSPAARLSPKNSKLSVGDWDDDDFMESLSKVPDDVDSGQYKKYIPSDEEELNQGGTRFQQMMEAARAAGPRRHPIPDAPSVPSPQSLAAQSMENMSVEEQAAVFRAMMQGQQSDIMPQQTRVQQGGVDAKGRKIGRNRDADTIANTSDLYFAQLKRDSSVRTMARIRGDDDEADKVFEDEGVRKLNEQLQTNPYLQRERQEQEESMLETVGSLADEMLASQLQREEKENRIKKNGPSYRKVLEARKKKKISPKLEASLPIPVPKTIEKFENERITTSQDSASIAFQMVEPGKTTAPSFAPPQPTQMEEMVPPKENIVSNKREKTSQPDQDDEDNTRRKIRSLMGMFLKHRGGKGFGSGLLRGKEVDDFEKLLKEVGSQLRTEAGLRETSISDVPTSISIPVQESPISNAHEISVEVPTAPETIPVPHPAAQQVEAHASPAIDVPPTSPHPATRQVEVPVSPAISIPPPPPAETTTSLTTTRTNAFSNASVEAALTCVEGAIQMYKNSPPELAEGMLMALRAALQSASNKCSKVIDGEFDQSIAMKTPPFHEAVLEETGEKVRVDASLEVINSQVTVNSDGLDSNSIALRKVYDALDSASGDGKLGLRSVSSEEASDLTDMISEMQNVLLEELEAGIPEGIPEDIIEASLPKPSIDTASKIPGGENTSSKYKEMLAKARAKKKLGASL